MIYNIIGCGETAKEWDGNGLAIGVNDCEKIGYPVGQLVIVNPPDSFENEPERMAVILKTKALVWTNLLDEWRQVLTTQDINSFEEDIFRPVGTKIRNKQEIYFSQTSPLVAMSLAYTLGATELRLYGVDFQTHHMYKPGVPGFDLEVQRYAAFMFALKQKGVEVRVTEGSYLSRFTETL